MIRIVKGVCTKGHVAIAIAYDDADHTNEALLERVHLTLPRLFPKCNICHCKNLSLVDQSTQWKQLADADSELTAIAIQNRADRLRAARQRHHWN